METYLVTGGAGFIGSNFIHYMMQKYKDDICIINYDALTYAGNLENLADISETERYHFVKGDVCDAEKLTDIFQAHDVDYVVHFAAETHVDRSLMTPELFHKTNVEGTKTLLMVADRAWKQADGTYSSGKRFLLVSTDEVYGSLPDDQTSFFYETTPYNPQSPYAKSKAEADLLVKSYIMDYGFPANITNCSNNYGAYQFPEKLIPLMIHNALEGKKLPVYGDGMNIRDWLYVMDHAKALDMVLHLAKPGTNYNVGGHNEKRNIEIVHLIIRTLLELLPTADERRVHINDDLIEYVKDRENHDRRYAICPDKIRTEIGWYPETSFETGIRETIRWYLEHEDWLRNVTSGEYQNYYEAMYTNR